MTIKDIAQLAGVSVSTVSKVVNGKDENINRETRERVLKIVKEYNYSPYASVKHTGTAKSFLLGVMLNGAEKYGRLMAGMMARAKESGYDLILCDSYGNSDTEQKNAAMLCRNRADGVIWDPVNKNSWKLSAYFEKYGIKNICIRKEVGELSGLSYEKMGRAAAQKLVDLGHNRLACIYEAERPDEVCFLEGFRHCLYENNISLEDMVEISTIDDTAMNRLLLKKVTGAAGAEPEQIMCLYERLERKKYKIPENISLISLCPDEENVFLPIASMKIPFYEYGRFLCEKLICRLEKLNEKDNFELPLFFQQESKIAPPPDHQKKRIIIVGNMNADIFLSVDECPQLGKVSVVKTCTVFPGGKGVNQACGVARLGREAVLIGRIGRDMEGTMICESLANNHVNVKGVLLDDREQTGKAYIHVDREGESGISIFSGANENLCVEDVRKNELLFKNAAFCLLQTEIPEETIAYAVNLAKRNGAQIMLKPSAVKEVSASIIKEIDFFIPNRKEMSLLCPQIHSIEKQAEYYLDQGVGTVIITLGQEGCYVKNRRLSRYFPAADFPAIDTTGGADAFISALAVYLLDGKTLEDAVQYAVCAAGFAVSRQGVVPALVDRNSLEMYRKRADVVQ